jgi:hypothetical protein
VLVWGGSVSSGFVGANLMALNGFSGDRGCASAPAFARRAGTTEGNPP